MKWLPRIAVLPPLLLAWLFELLFVLLVLLLDLVCLPWVRARRQPQQPADRAPAGRNASILVLNWNGLHFLRDLLPSLQVAVARCPGDHEVIVIDNGSTDGSADWCAKEHPWAKVVRVPRNLFFIRGNAEGVKVATRDILVFLNNDMRVEPEFLVRLLAPFGPPDLFAVSARILMQGRQVETGCTRAVLRRGDLRLLHVDGSDQGLVPSFWAGGGSTAYDRAKYLAIGGFELLYDPCYVEDVSLSYEAWKRGWRVQYEGRSQVHHAHRGTSQKVFGNRRVDRLNRRNLELFWWRSITDPWLCLQHALFVPWNLLKHGRHTGHWLQLSARLRALRRLPWALLVRQRSRPLHRRTDREVLRLANSVTAYRRQFAAAAAAGPITVLSFGHGSVPPVHASLPAFRWQHVTLQAGTDARRPREDLFGLLPRRCCRSGRDGPEREQCRHALAETEHDLVWFTDLDGYAAAAPFLDAPAVVQIDAFVPADGGVERWRERRWFRQLGRRATVVCRDAAVADRLRPLLGTAPVVLDANDPKAVRDLLASRCPPAAATARR